MQQVTGHDIGLDPLDQRASTFMARPHQSTSVLSGISAPMRAKISFRR
jgi:hypothetical protein